MTFRLFFMATFFLNLIEQSERNTKHWAIMYQVESLCNSISAAPSAEQ